MTQDQIDAALLSKIALLLPQDGPLASVGTASGSGGEVPFGPNASGRAYPQARAARQARRLRNGAAVDVVLSCPDGRRGSGDLH